MADQTYGFKEIYIDRKKKAEESLDIYIFEIDYSSQNLKPKEILDKFDIKCTEVIEFYPTDKEESVKIYGNGESTGFTIFYLEDEKIKPAIFILNNNISEEDKEIRYLGRARA